MQVVEREIEINKQRGGANFGDGQNRLQDPDQDDQAPEY